MVISKRVGAVLKETRESKKITIREVSQETNITPRFIEALENEDYTVFPGETYALGFLKGYAEFLNLDTDEIISLYRGLQIDQSKTPLHELTRPMRVIPYLNQKYVVYGFAALLGLTLLISLVTYIDFSSFAGKGDKTSAAALPCSDRQVLSVSIPASGDTPRVENLAMDNTLRFAADTVTVRFCLEQVKKLGDGSRSAEFSIVVNDESAGKLQAKEGESIILNRYVESIAKSEKPIQVTPKTIGDYSVRVQLETALPAGANTGSETPDAAPVQPGQNADASAVNAPASNVTAGIIQVTLRFTADSYFQWTVDGVSHTGLIMSAGKTRTLEAKNRLEIKVGNGGGVEILRAGQPPKISGPVGRFVRIIYKRVPDPLDPGLYKIQESLEIVR